MRASPSRKGFARVGGRGIEVREERGQRVNMTACAYRSSAGCNCDEPPADAR